MEDVEAAFYEAWEDAGLADEAPPRAKGSRPSSQNKRKVRPPACQIWVLMTGVHLFLTELLTERP